MSEVKVEMLESTYFEGENYERGEKYVMDRNSAKALGSSVKVLGKAEKPETDKKVKSETKDVKKPETDKMMTGSQAETK